MSDDQTPAEDHYDDDAAQDAAEMDALRAEVAALKDQALRYAADAENTKRRAEREVNDARAYAIQKFARDLLGAADALERALAAAPKDADAEGSGAALASLATGVEMTEKTLQQAFERNGLKKVAPDKGTKFDPHLHQAMMEQPSTEVAAGGVIQTLQTGYELFGRIVRPAMVVVAAKGSTGEAAPNTASEPLAGESAPQNPYGAHGEGDAGASVDTKA